MTSVTQPAPASPEQQVGLEKVLRADARRNREAEQGKNASTRNHFRLDLFSHHGLLLGLSECHRRWRSVRHKSDASSLISMHVIDAALRRRPSTVEHLGLWSIQVWSD